MYSPKQKNVAQLFPESRDIIDAFKDSQIPMAVASRSPTPETAKSFLKTLGDTLLQGVRLLSHCVSHQ